MDESTRLTLESRSKICVGQILWGLCAAVIVGIGLAVGSSHWIAFAILPATLAISIGWAWPGAFRGWLDDQQLTIEAPEPETIPIDAIECVTLAGRARLVDEPTADGKVMVMHREGVVQIPKGLNVPGDELYAKLIDLCRDIPFDDRPSQLADECARQEQTFGTERVWLFCARNYLGSGSRSRSRAVGTALMLTGAGWCIFGGLAKGRGEDPFFGLGFVAFLIGLIAYAVGCQFGGRYPFHRLADWDKASLLVSPGGIWLTQGDLKGHLQWEELKEMRIGRMRDAKLTHSRVAPSGALVLIVPGTQIVIWDIYDRPLAVIHDIMFSFWRPS
ncbi:MAG TPA: hypothetical protein VHV77_17730 [Pirellulales bacterium]|nr:hypothetical protein [Pirellulales bacterium]